MLFHYFFVSNFSDSRGQTGRTVDHRVVGCRCRIYTGCSIAHRTGFSEHSHDLMQNTYLILMDDCFIYFYVTQRYDSRAFRCTQIWMFLELFLLVVSTLQLLLLGPAYSTKIFSPPLDPLEIVELVVVSFYRLVVLILAKVFTERLKHSWE